MKSLRILLISCVLLSACGRGEVDGEPSTDEPDHVEVSLTAEGKDPVTITVEVADDPEERSVGLMNRTELGEDTGMLFVFEREMTVSFWMKNTLIPLDIIYFDTDGAFVSTSKMEPCEADPCPSYYSLGDARYGLEVPAGFVRKRGVGTGWKLVW
ncbi:MAG: DUF192 domain-containing protein [Candidatus Peregrinibacteria bacterium]|nr:DUF192 domain-containing protein [Candidatus Peregrinibacteria bacterium]